jgi:hypothetical protein
MTVSHSKKLPNIAAELALSSPAATQIDELGTFAAYTSTEKTKS